MITKQVTYCIALHGKHDAVDARTLCHAGPGEPIAYAQLLDVSYERQIGYVNMSVINYSSSKEKANVYLSHVYMRQAYIESHRPSIT